jgi:predicted acyltransferase
LTPINASLAYALAFVGVWYAILLVLERRNVIVRL